MPSQFIRSQNGVIAGVCKGLAKAFDMDEVVIRIGFILAFLFFGTGILVYGLLWVSFPSEDQLHKVSEPRILGVCVRLANRLKIDIGFMRLIACIGLVASFGTMTLVYVILHIAMPKDDEKNSTTQGS